MIETSTHWTFTCLKSAIETLNQGVKSVQNEHKRHQKDFKWCCLGVFINSIEFEQGNAGWVEPLKKGVFKITVL